MGVQDMKMNKKGLTFKAGFYAIIAVGMIIASVSLILGEWDVAYNSNLPDDLDTFDRTSSISNTVQDQKESISPETNDAGSDFEATTFRGVFGIIVNIFEPFENVFGSDGMLAEISNRYGIPNYVGQGIVVLMIVAITFTIGAVIFRKIGDTI